MALKKSRPLFVIARAYTAGVWLKSVMPFAFIQLRLAASSEAIALFSLPWRRVKTACRSSRSF